MFRLPIVFLMCTFICMHLRSQMTLPVSDTGTRITLNGEMYTSIKDKNKVMISWPSMDSINIDYYSLERKTNDLEYELVGVIKRDSLLKNYQWFDEAATVGRHQYRLFIVTPEGHKNLLASSKVIMPGATDIKFYPNPVENVLIIRSSYPLDVMILDGQGMIRIPMFQVNGLYTLNVSQLKKGVYYIRFQNKLTGIVSQERLAKN
ncbi:MAG: T9SS type A sorting domain-containing protein [Flavitalea sp.]